VILVDTSVWIDHLHRAERHLVELLEQAQVLVHPVVVAEIALGSVRDRATVLSLLDALPSSRPATDPEVRRLVDERALWGRGLGFGDAHLLASTLITPGGRLWTRDKRPRAAAAELGVEHPAPPDG
jgi:predicted nucleic acid-binding protein